jgi:hypothetical protein
MAVVKIRRPAPHSPDENSENLVAKQAQSRQRAAAPCACTAFSSHCLRALCSGFSGLSSSFIAIVYFFLGVARPGQNVEKQAKTASPAAGGHPIRGFAGELHPD